MTLLQNGYRVWVVSDACGSRKNTDRDAAFTRLQQAGAHLVTLEMVAFEWMRDSRHPLFREVLKLIK
jgi:nicotinamidase-related amidase